MKKIMAALRDPKTKKIFTGESHAHVMEALEDDDSDIYRRIRKEYVSTGRSPEAKHCGFTDGVEFLNRAQSLKKWGVFNSMDLRRVNGR